MDYQATFAISAAGMNVERTRYEIAAVNLANASTVSGSAKTGFQPRRLIAIAQAAGASSMSGETFLNLVQQGLSAPSYQIETTGAAPRRAHDSAHPLADAKGDVYYPGVDTATETMTMLTAVRSYEANVAALNTARTLALRALDIGGSS
ncbi:MAG TPA: flagellar basal body rod C-terminal domain-containing protein [Burkholderiaceae bacterium]|jgi:flagellar basal-body rod protein FlgC